MPETGLDTLQVLRALADPRRLRIVEALAQRDRDVEDLCAELGLSQPAVSHHLRILRECKLVASRRAGRFQDYSLLPSALRQLGNWLLVLGTNPDNETVAQRFRDLVLEEFLDQPLPRTLPRHPRKRSLVGLWFLEQLEGGRFYRKEELERLLAPQLMDWQALLDQWVGLKEVDGNGILFRKP